MEVEGGHHRRALRRAGRGQGGGVTFAAWGFSCDRRLSRPPKPFLGPGAIPAVDAVVVEAVRTAATFEESSRPVIGADDAVVRATGILGLGAVAIIHFSQVVSTIDQTPWLGAAFVALTVACMVLAGQLLRRGSRLRWAQVAVVNFMAVGGYIFTRSFSTPSTTAMSAAGRRCYVWPPCSWRAPWSC